jgi:hypothetical protein
MESLGELADEIASVQSRVSDIMFDALRAQLRNDQADQSKELERRLAKVRRSLEKAEMLLRGASDD